MTPLIEIETPDGRLRFRRGRAIKGDPVALQRLNEPRPGFFGAIPGCRYNMVRHRKDSFIHLVSVIWPNYTVVKDTEPEPEYREDVIY